MFRERDAHIRGAGPAWALRIEVERSALVTVNLSEATVQQWLEAERAALVGSVLPRDSPINAMFNRTFGESRTREEFHEQVLSRGRPGPRWHRGSLEASPRRGVRMSAGGAQRR
jgi:hypothetical protein